MLEPRLKEYMTKAYAKLGGYGYDIVLNFRKGKDYTPKQKELVERAIKTRLLLRVLFRHIDLETVPPTLYRITENEVNKLINCLLKIAELNNYPVYPSLLPTSKPIKLSQLAAGPTGATGTAGLDANIIVEPDTGEDEILVTEAIISLIKHYRLNLNLYIAPILESGLSISIFEVGTSNTPTISLTSTKGRNNIVTLTANDSTINTALQVVVNLTTLNGVSQPVLLSFASPAQTANKTVIFTTNDGANNAVSTIIFTFVYPFLHGNSEITGINPYTALTKLIETKTDKEVTFSGNDDYFWFAYPASYGDLISIKDNNEDEVIDLFTKTVASVTSTGLVSNWTVSYNIYRTTLKTTINTAIFKFKF